jgi:hypothetical protein
MSEPLPIWDERERPTVLAVDFRQPGEYASTLMVPDPNNQDFADWLNTYKVPLLQDIEAIHSDTLRLFERRHIDVGAVACTVADIQGGEPFPPDRCTHSFTARSSAPYRTAANLHFYERCMATMDGSQAWGQYVHLMDFVRFRGRYLARAPRVSVVDTTAFAFAHATLQRLTPVTVPRHADQPSRPYAWAGYCWRYDGRYYGELLSDAQAAKTAAITRRELGTTEHLPSVHPVIDQYRERNGIAYGALGAIVLDLINQAAGHQDELAIYRPIWEFIRAGEDAAAREELASQVRFASKGNLQLEQLEALPYTSDGISPNNFRQIECALNIPRRDRPSTYLVDIPFLT